jgi:hypothetical protein
MKKKFWTKCEFVCEHFWKLNRNGILLIAALYPAFIIVESGVKHHDH